MPGLQTTNESSAPVVVLLAAGQVYSAQPVICLGAQPGRDWGRQGLEQK